MRRSLMLLAAVPLCAAVVSGAWAHNERAQQLAQAPDGRAVYALWCAACHDAGPGHPGTLRLATDRGKDESVLLQRRDLTADYVATVIRNGFQMMPPFRPTEIPDPEVAAVAAYVASHGAASSEVQP